MIKNNAIKMTILNARNRTELRQKRRWFQNIISSPIFRSLLLLRFSGNGKNRYPN